MGRAYTFFSVNRQIAGRFLVVVVVVGGGGGGP